MDQDHNRKKRIRSDHQGDPLEKKIKHNKRRDQQQQGCYSNNVDTIKSIVAADHRGGEADVAAAALGVFDFPWLKDGGGVARSDEWKLEDYAFVSQLQGETGGGVSSAAATTITTPAGFEFSFPGNCSLSRGSPAAAEDFPVAKFDEEEYELRLSWPPLEFETAESLDRIWSAFA